MTFKKAANILLCTALVFGMLPARYAIADPDADSGVQSTTQSSPSAAADGPEAEKDEAGSKEGSAVAEDQQPEQDGKQQPAAKKDRKGSSKKADKKAREAAKLEDKAESIANKLGNLAVRLETATEDLASINVQVADAEADLESKKKKLKKTKATLKKARENVGKSAKAMYMNGETRLMSVLLGATDFEDFASRMYLYEAITGEWQRTFEKAEKLQKKIDKETKEIDEKVSQLAALRKEAEAKGKSISDSVEEQTRMLSKLDKKLSKLVNKKTDKYIKRYTKAYEKANSAAVSWYSGLDGFTSSKKGSHPVIVDIASKYLGVDYVWGGETPSGFDCSGLVMYCYRKIGINLPRTAREQFDAGTHVSKKGLMPGDLLFFGPSISGIHHVGIYVGDGKYLHAPHTGDVVKISELADRSDCVGATRPKKA